MMALRRMWDELVSSVVIHHTLLEFGIRLNVRTIFPLKDALQFQHAAGSRQAGPCCFSPSVLSPPFSHQSTKLPTSRYSNPSSALSKKDELYGSEAR